MEGYGNENPGAFQSTRPLRGATLTGMTFREMFGISTHAPLAGRDLRHQRTHADERKISTHAPLAGRDMPPKRRNQHENISTHAPLAGRDQEGKQAYGSNEQFQPTRPLRGATLWALRHGAVELFQPTRPLRGATIVSDRGREEQIFQPTRPLRGATAFESLDCIGGTFQPTRPLRGATMEEQFRLKRIWSISTHAPLAGRDLRHGHDGKLNPISTHAPLAGRDHLKKFSGMPSKVFQPTRPLRGATQELHVIFTAARLISTHAPLAGRDYWRILST